VFLGGALAVLGVLVGLNRSGVERLLPYLIVGAILWFLVLQSGVHATIAGVLLAMVIPLRRTPGRPEASECALIRLEHALQPWAAFLIVPIFGFANAGVSFAGMSASALAQPVPLGIALGLFVGKQIGVFAFAWGAIRAGLADVPARATWAQLYGVAILCGIGFTMSLFIGLLAFPDTPGLQDEVKIGVLTGSVVSALAGAILLLAAKAEPNRERPVTAT
jgi:Na+:H+ antiporter, NhaA family